MDPHPLANLFNRSNYAKPIASELSALDYLYEVLLEIRESENCDEVLKEETILYNIDTVIPTAYIEKPPFPVRIKEHAKVSTVVNKSYIRTPKPNEQIKVEPSVAMVKDLLEENIDGHVIYFYNEATRIAKPNKEDKHRPVVGMPVVSVKIGDHCYHGLCDIDASVSAIPYTLY